VPSDPPVVTNRAPDGSKAMLAMGSESACSGWPTAWPVAVFHSWTMPAKDPVARVPSGAKAREIRGSLCTLPRGMLLVENPAASTCSAQPDPPRAAPLPKSFPYSYLEAFERLITSYEHPPIRDSALPSAGQCPRANDDGLAGQGIRPGDQERGDGRRCDGAVEAVEATLPGTMPTLAVSLRTSTEDQLCALAPQSGFRATGNQYYRCGWYEKGVKWSRDNGSVVFPGDRCR
jgi:hypothetical protein